VVSCLIGAGKPLGIKPLTKEGVQASLRQLNHLVVLLNPSLLVCGRLSCLIGAGKPLGIKPLTNEGVQASF
jgi:hypothetical protein